MTQHVIFLEGVDRCGKTNIGQQLSRLTGVCCFKASSEHESYLSSKVTKREAFLNQLRYADPRVFDVLKQTGHSLMFDRGFPSEYVYSKVMNRPTDILMIKHMDEMWASLGAKIVWCQRSDYTGIVDDIDPTIDAVMLQKLHAVYEEFASWTKCKLLKLNVDDENLDREVTEVMEFMKA